MEGIERHHAEGNKLYKDGLYSQAIAAWEEGIKAAGATPLSTQDTLLLSKSHANISHAYLQLHEYSSAESAALAAMKLDPTNTKAAVRRATALLALERYEDARRVVEKAKRNSLLLSLLKSINNLQTQIQRMATLAQGPGGRDPDAGEAKGLVDEAQTLRLSFKDPPASVCLYGEWMTVTLYLANEFGLWKRGDFPCNDPTEETLPLVFQVFDHGGNFCETSKQVKVEAVMVPEEGDGEEEEEEEEKKGGDKGGGSKNRNTTSTVPVLKRGSSCRLCVRLRFTPLDDDNDTSNVAPPPSSIVHLMLSLPEEKLSRDVLPVFSVPIHLSPIISTTGQRTHKSSNNILTQHQDLVIHSCRGIYVQALQRRILIGESQGQIFGKIWDAGLVASHYLAQHPEILLPPSLSPSSPSPSYPKRSNTRRRVIELGAGTGITGVAAALLGAAEVIITDLAPVVPLIQTNIDLNLSGRSSSSSSSSLSLENEEGGGKGRRRPGRAVAKAYSWGGDRSEIGLDPYFVILLADVIYQPCFYSSLVKALWDLSDKDTVIILAHRERHPDCALFFKEADEKFTRKMIPFAFAGGGDSRSCQDVQIFEMRRR